MKIKTKLDKKANKGITLIALVITIIVLLILAGVSIATLTGEGGILSKANNAKTQTDQANAKEQAQIAVFGSYDNNGKLDINELKTELGKIDKVGTITDTNGDFPVKTTIDGQGITIDQKGNVTVEGGSGGENTPTAPSTAETSPFVPTGAKKIEGTIDTGLVMTDSNDNEWVWIEVPKTTMVYQTAGLAITNFTEEEYTKIENDLKTYAGDYRGSYTDTWKSEAQHGFAEEADYNNWKKSMLKSVYENGGFYIGRYEVGTEDPRTASSTELPTPLIQRDKYPYIYITCSQAQTLAKQLKTGDKTSSLMFGIQWDLVMKFIEEKGTKLGGTKAERQAKLKTNSTDWGNYRDASFMIERGKGAILNTSTSPYTLGEWNLVSDTPKEADISMLLTTGSTDRNSVSEIYDLAGNVWEWTLECTDDTSNPCAIRGGIYDYTGSAYPASRRYYNSTSSSYGYIGCRSALW